MEEKHEGHDDFEGLSEDELDLGLGAAFRKRQAPDEPSGFEGPEPRDPRGVMASIRAAHGVAAAVDLDDETDAGVDSSGDGDPIRTPRYDVHGEIARGGMGAIFRVRDRDLRRSLAMKVLLGRRRDDPSSSFATEHLNRFLEEAQVTAQLAHPGVVPVHELGIDADGRVFFTMSLVRGKTLSEIIRLARRREDGWTLPRALQVILRVCETLAYAHDKGVIHRDIKPDNVMVGRFGETYLMDWGLAKVLDRADLHDLRLSDVPRSKLSVIETKRDEGGDKRDSPILTMDGAVVGTPAYMPPEQARGVIADVDERADVYAVGALLYELLTGNAPYVEPGKRVTPHVVLVAVHVGPPKPVREIDPKLPEEIVAICEKAMAREREDRYASALELAEDLQAFIEGRVVKAYRTGPVVELRKWVGRNRPLAASLAAAVLLAIAGSLGYALQAQDAAEKIGLERDKVDAERKQVAIERDKEAAARWRAEGLRLSARAGNEGIKYPGSALGLAIEGAARADDVYGRTALYRALANLHEIATLEGHSTAPDAVAFDESAERVVTASLWNGEVIAWDLATRTPLARIEGDQEPYTTLDRGTAVHQLRSRAIARFGRRVATAAGARLRISDPYEGRALQVLDMGAFVESLSWDEAGERLAIVTAAGRVRVWRPPAEEADLELDLGVTGRSAVALRRDGSQVAVQSPDGRVIVHDVATGERVAALPAHADGPEFECTGSLVAWLDDGRQLLSWRGSHSRKEPARAEIWDVAAGRRVAAFGDATMTSLLPVSDAEGTAVALPLLDPRDGSGHVVVWDVSERGERARLPEPRHLYGFSPRGRLLIANDQPHVLGRAFQLWDTRTGEHVADLRGHTYHLAQAAVTDSGLVATASGDSTLRLWRSSSALELRETAGWDVRVRELFADLRRAITWNAEVRSVPDGRVLCTLPGAFGQVSIDPASNRVAFVDHATNRLHVVDGWEGRPLLDWAGPTEKAASVQFSPDGAQLAVLADGRIHLHDPVDGARLGGFDPGLGKGVGFAWCPDGRTMVVHTYATRQLVEYDVTTGDVVRRYEDRHSGWITTLAISPTGKLLATGAADRSVIVWDRATGEVVHRFTGLFMGDVRLHFDPTERFLVASLATDVTAILDVERGEVFGEVPGYSIYGPIVFDGGDAIVGIDKGERVLRVPLAPLATARRVQPHPLSPLELSVYDVGNPDERAVLEDAYVAWTFAPHRILPVALGAVAAGDLDRAAKHLARIEQVSPDAHERLVLRAALHLAKGATAAALEALERAVDEGCDPRPLRHAVFDDLRETEGWKPLAAALAR